MNARIIQYPFGPKAADIEANFKWILDKLDACDKSLDLIVLPEGCETPGPVADKTEYFSAAALARNEAVLEKAAATARRCAATLFVNALDKTPTGWRNTTFAFAPDGTLAGRYNKRHLTPGERSRMGLDDAGYTTRRQPVELIEIAGDRYACLICYDFYFYEEWAAIARARPDVVIGSSRQRTDSPEALDAINRHCAYNTGAWLVRASVSMGEHSQTGGCSCVVAPDGRTLALLRTGAGILDASFDPHWKFLKPAGFGGAVGTHPDYVEAGRRPWSYRSAGGAIVPRMGDRPRPMLCAHRGWSAALPENSLPSLASAVALGAEEIEFDLWWTKDGEIVSIHDPTLDRVSNGKGWVYDHTMEELADVDFGAKAGERLRGLHIVRFEDILRKLACHTLMNIHVKDAGGAWNEATAKKLVRLIEDYDAQDHVYFMTACGPLQDQLARLAPGIPRCMGYGGGRGARPDIVDRAIEHKCQMVQLFKPYFDQSTFDRAREAGLKINIFWSDDPEEARRFLDMGGDTVLTNDYLAMANALREQGR